MIEIGKTLYILSDQVYLQVDHDSVVVKQDRKILNRIPLVNIAQIIVIANAVISAYLIDACQRNRISISYISPHGRYIGTFYGRQIGNVMLRKRQYAADESDQKLAIAKNIVLGKIVNQMALLAKYEAKAESVKKARSLLARKIPDLLSCKDIARVRGVEGECAAGYFSVFDDILTGCEESMKFHERSKRPPKNRFNALLSLLYTLETTSCVSAVYAYGLDPFLGYLHEVHPGRESLACDLVEEFRAPVVDAFVLREVNLRKITEKDFEESEGRFSLSAAGKKNVLANWEKYKETRIYCKLYQKEVPIKILPYIQAQLLGQYLRGDIAEYPPFTDWR